jgi:polysaccharide export outer membrane protein
MHGREKIDSNVYSRQASLILLKDSTNSSDGTKCFDEIVFAGEGGLLFGRPKKLQFRTLRRRQGSGPTFYSFPSVMDTRSRSSRLFGTLLLVAACGGCHVIYPGRKVDGPTPNVPVETPRELSKVTLPDYIVEPPDVLSIEAISLLPKQPYELRPLDAVAIVTQGLPEESNLAGEFVVQANGSLDLGFAIGSIQAAGKTAEAVQAELLERLKSRYAAPEVSVTLIQMGAQQQIAGDHLVAPDGKVNLGTYGRVRVVGLTLEEARSAIETHLSTYLEKPQIALDVLGYNSKVYYVVTQGAGLGDRVIILPSRGNETVIDAIGQIQGLASNSSTRMWIARPGANQCGGDQILPVDWLAVTQRGDVTTNYQLLPGDRLYVSEDKLVALDTKLGKIFSPLERLFGFTSLATSTARNVVFFNRFGGGFGGGFTPVVSP